MEVSDVYLELYGRIPELVRGAVDGLTAEQLRTPPSTGANPIGWLAWHLARVQDHHVGELLAEAQLWETGDWAARFGLDADPSNIGYGHEPADVASVQPESAAVCVDYYDAVHARTAAMLRGLSSAELDRVVDKRWDPPVTLGVRLMSIADDAVQHLGQAAYARGQLGY
jgi:uncharacterized damage-inducible protein DinB